MLTLAKNAIAGTVMGRPVNAFALDGKADAAPAPGEYDLLPPLEDPVFGVYIIAVRRGSGFKPGYDWRKLTAEPGVAVRHEGIKLPTTRMVEWKMPAGASSEDSFVLSKQPIPGRNCVVLASGFADLLEALKGAPEAALTVI
ncbi:hypothetical protein RA210_U30205 [Rubrivivax sp. A210]|uniref:hypothetical protein n=1 Tax=Rubrivivax sp. A210 TaxID=2772301 RepID=UPI00191B0771|nr:hypothetical protein [Rubrivivax sp. A210]CAD5373293.1 hypothetical protein RA210_U30205 [Rubrivivax sp. A210]